MDIHRCRFVDYTPHVITALAFSHSSNTATPPPAGLRLAVGRSNGDIEIWNPRHNWTHELTLPGARGRAVEGLVWAHGEDSNPRLFSIGGSTYITEWDLATGRPKANLNCNAGVIWCMDANATGTRLAVGCDDGSVVIIGLDGGVMEFEFICQRQELRVLGIKWFNQDTLIGGCADGKVRCWDVSLDSKGRIVSSIKVDKLKTESTLVWSIECFPKRNQFVTGDSTGSVKFWDFTNFTLIQSFSVHEADVLCLTKDFTEEKLFSAGIDRKIHQYSFLKMNNTKKGTKWIHNFNRLLHLNDVRTLALFECKSHTFLISGGVERSLIVQTVNGFQNGLFKKILMDQQISNIISCSASNLVAMFNDQTIKIWRIQADKHKLVAKLSLSDDDNITSISIGEPLAQSAVSYLAVATINSVKIFSLVDSGTKLQVLKLKDSSFASVISGAKFVRIFNNNRLLIQTAEDELYTFTIDEESIELDDELELSAPDGKVLRAGYDHYNTIRSVVMSKDETEIAVAKFNNSIEIVSLDGTHEPYVIATTSSVAQLVQFTDYKTLVVLNEENKLYEFNLENRSSALLTKWSQRNSDSMPSQYLKLDQKPQGLFVQGSRVWTFGSTWLSFIDMTLDFDASKSISKKRARDELSILGESSDTISTMKNGQPKQDEDEVDEKTTVEGKQKKPFWMTEKYRPILKVDLWGEDGILVVEREAFALPSTTAFEAPQLRI